MKNRRCNGKPFLRAIREAGEDTKRDPGLTTNKWLDREEKQFENAVQLNKTSDLRRANEVPKMLQTQIF